MNWFRSFLEDFMPKRGVPSIPNPPSPPPVAPKPEPSCFAKGIARSIETEPEAWKQTEKTFLTLATEFDVTHETSDVRLVGAIRPIRRFGNYSFECLSESLEGCLHFHSLRVKLGLTCVSGVDCCLIARAIEANPIGQLKTKLDADKLAHDKQDAAIAHFTTLGCPPSQ